MSRAPLAKLRAYKRRMGWNFPWASSYDSEFNVDFQVVFSEEQQRKGAVEYNYRTVDMRPDPDAVNGPVDGRAPMGHDGDVATYHARCRA